LYGREPVGLGALEDGSTKAADGSHVRVRGENLAQDVRPVGADPVVVVDKTHDLVPRRVYASTAGVHEAKARFPDHVERCGSARLGPRPLRDLGCIVRRGIVDDYHLPVSPREPFDHPKMC
jgi:hypothetical protein